MLDKTKENRDYAEKRKTKKQYVFIDFYNLRLKSGYIVGNDPLDTSLEFSVFAYKPLGPSSDNPLYYRPPNAPLSNFAKFPEDEERQKVSDFLIKYNSKLDIAESWFDSADFLEFTEEYRHAKTLLDGYINDRLHDQELNWLNNKTLGYKKLLFDTDKRISKYKNIYCKTIYGLGIGKTICQIHNDLLYMLQRFEADGLKIKYCVCGDIFIQWDQRQKFCGDACKNNYHNIFDNKADYIRRRRDKNSPDFDSKYIK
jgi:hypothetical protein